MAGGLLISELMNRQKKLAIMPRLHNYDGDTSKQWFVFYSFRNPKSGKMQRFRIYEGFTTLKTAEEKTQHGLKLADKIRQKLLNGWSPFQDEQKVVYEDSLQYSKVAKKYGRQRQSNKRFDYYTSKWLDQKVGIRPATYTTYKSKLRYFNEFLRWGGIYENDISEFGADHAREFNLWLRKKRKLGNKSINEYNVLMMAFFRYLIDDGLVKENPFSKIKPLKTEPKKPRIYSNELLTRISKKAARHDPQLLMAIRLIFNCFIRPKELRYLKLENIDLTRGKIIVPASVAKDKEERTVDIPYYILDDFRKFNKMPQNWYLVSQDNTPGPEMVSRNFLYRRFVKLKKIIKLPREYKLYAFKHTGMVELKRSGADWLDVKQQAGHESIDQTIAYTMSLMADGSSHIREKAPQI
jgi:integrase